MTDKALIGFGGFGGPEIALHNLGIKTLSIELDPSIAEVSRYNGNDVITADLLDINPADYVGWLLYHFSPPCPSFSVANQSSTETELDIALARKICEFIQVGRPRYFTLENVFLYRKSLSWALILVALLEEGYGVGQYHLNSADYGVPQTRRRMIVIARRDGQQPAKPWATHQKLPDMLCERWRGWYEAIEDLIPGLSDTQFAAWQERAMPEKLRSCLINNNKGNSPKLITRDRDQPAYTVVASLGQKGAMPRAFILGQGQRSKPKPGHLPADTVTGNNNQTGVKAFVMANANTRANNGNGTIRGKDEPMFTVLANSAQHNAMAKAFIVGGQYQTPSDGSVRVVQNKGANSPIWTICASDNLDTRIYASGRIISMSVRCLARFQDFPDSFVLPGEPGLIDNPILLADKRTDRELACRGVGNALPPGVSRAVLGSLGIGGQNGH